MMTKNIYINHTSIVVPDYDAGDCDKLEGLLSVWDRTTFSFKRIGYYYDEDSRTLYLPRAIDISYVEKLLDRKAIVNYESDARAKASIKLTVEPRNDLQKKSISFLVGVGEFKDNQKRSQQALTLSTGAGKTYCTCAAISVLNTKAIIMTHNDNIKHQWFSSLADYTNLDFKEILEIKGSAGIKKIMKAKKLPYKVYIVNRQTINSYGKAHGWEAVREFFKKIEVGIKVYDEAHIEFKTILKIDFFSNAYKTFYLTANFERSDPNENRVFKLAFKNMVKYGEESVDILKKNIVYMPVFFNSKPSYSDRAGLKTMRGLDRNKYAEYLLNSDAYYETIRKIFPTIRGLFDDAKILFMSTTIDATIGIKKFLEDEYDVAVAVYNSKISEEDKEKALQSDYISSTPKSLGTGTDVPGLRIIINSEPYRSAVTANQVSGRLRYHGDSKYSFYIELIDKGFPEVMRMYKARQSVFAKKCASIKEIHLEDD